MTEKKTITLPKDDMSLIYEYTRIIARHPTDRERQLEIANVIAMRVSSYVVSSEEFESMANE